MIKESLFFINFVNILNIFLKELLTVSVDAAIKRTELLKKIYKNIKNMQK